MRCIKGRSRGFTLIASLLVLALLSAIAVSLLFMVQGAGQVGSNDLETNRAYYGAESGMERSSIVRLRATGLTHGKGGA